MKAFGIEVNLNKADLKRIFLPIASLVLGCGLLIFVVIPKIRQIPDLKAERETSENTLTKLEKKSKTLSRLETQKEALAEDYALMKEALSVEPEIPTLVDQVQQIATDSAVAIGSLAYTDTQAKTKKTSDAKSSRLIELGVRLTIEGSYDNLLAYLRSVEKASRILTVDTLRFSLLGGAEQNLGIVETNIGLISYVFPEEEKASVEAPFDLNRESPEYINTMKLIRSFRIYRAIVDPYGVGKRDPFSR